MCLVQVVTYCLPVESVQPEFQAIAHVDRVVRTFGMVGTALHNHDQDKVADPLPDSRIRRRVVDAFSQLAPKPGSGWRLDLSEHGAVIRMDDTWQRSIRKMYASAETEPDRDTGNGELIEINFAGHQITILPLGTGRELKVTYP